MKRKTGAKGIMAIKIDLEKAYDRLKWSFVRDTLIILVCQRILSSLFGSALVQSQ